MAYDLQLAARVREYLAGYHDISTEEKKMFRGLTFMVNGKMCVAVSGTDLMCRFDPALQETVAGKKGFKQMLMKERIYNGYCYVSAEAIKAKKDFEYWIKLCLDFNEKAKASRKR